MNLACLKLKRWSVRQTSRAVENALKRAGSDRAGHSRQGTEEQEPAGVSVYLVLSILENVASPRQE
jgi:hypothetical protein